MSPSVNQADFPRGRRSRDGNYLTLELPARNGFRRQLRKQCITLPLRNHLDKSFDAPSFQVNRRKAPAAFSSATNIHYLLAKAVFLRRQPELARIQHVLGNPGGLDQAMPGPDIQKKRLIEKRLLFDTRQAERGGENAGVDQILVERFDDALRGHLLDCQLNPRIAGGELPQEQGHQVRRNGRNDTQPELAGKLVRAAVPEKRKSLVLGEDNLRLLDESLAVLRRKNGLLVSIEQHNAKLFLELAQLCAQRRLRYMTLCRRPAKVPGLIERNNVFKLSNARHRQMLPEASRVPHPAFRAERASKLPTVNGQLSCVIFARVRPEGLVRDLLIA